MFRQSLTNAINAVRTFVAFVRKRLGERSTLMALGVAVTGASALMHPWDFVFVALGVIGVLMPDGPHALTGVVNTNG